MSEYKLLDVQALLTRVNHKPERIKTLLTLFIATYEEHIQKVRSAYLNSDYKVLSDQAHALKGTLGNLGVTALYNQAQMIEQESLKEHLLEQNIIEDFDKELIQFVNECKKYISH